MISTWSILASYTYIRAQCLKSQTTYTHGQLKNALSSQNSLNFNKIMSKVNLVSSIPIPIKEHGSVRTTSIELDKKNVHVR